RSQFRTAGDDRGAQPLIADQGQKRIIGDRAALWSAAAVRAVTGLAVGLIGNFSFRNVALGFLSVGRQTRGVDVRWAARTQAEFAREYIDLLVGQHSAGTLGEGRHGSSAHTVGDNV